MTIRVFIADRQEMFREALRRLLESESGFVVVGDTDDGERLASIAASLQVDVLLMDLELRGRSGIEVLREVTRRCGAYPLLLVDYLPNEIIIQALVAGARGAIRKSAQTSLLFKAIRAVAAGEYWVSHAGISELVQNLCRLSSGMEEQSRRPAGALTQQQVRIIQAIAAGCSNKEIARDLSLSERTVKYHLTRIFNKIGVSGRMELARYSLRNKLVREA